MGYGRQIKIKEFKEKLNSSDKSLAWDYHQIFQSFAKRVDYCNIYYAEFAKVATPEAIAHDYDTDVFGSKDEVIDYRLYYEANALAFLQNIHALCDTVPYAVNKILFRDKSEDYVKWDKNFVANVRKQLPKEKEFAEVLDKFMKKDDFLRLKAYVNKAKHQHLVTILNNSSELKFSDFTYPLYNAKKEKAIAQGENVEKFMLRVHESLISDLIYIYNYMYQLI